MIQEQAFYDLDGPVRRLGAMHVPIPFSPSLEDVTVPSERQVFDLARQMCNQVVAVVATERTADARTAPSEEMPVAIKTYGTMAVDWEQRIDFDRLRRSGWPASRTLLAKSELGSVLCFDMNNVRYITATHIGTWAQDKISRFTLLPQNDEPILWDFGSAAKHHRINCDWLGERSRAGIPLMRGAMTPEMGRSEEVARKIYVELKERGLHKEPVGVDVVEPPILFALQKAGLNIVDGQQLMSDAREIKTRDEISLLTHSAAMVDAAYYELYKAMKPGMRENDAVALVAKTLYEMGSEYVEGVNAISAERASPHPHVFSDRMMRPGDPVFYDILHSYMGYRTCYYRCFAISSASHAAGGRLQALPRLPRRVDRADSSRPLDGRSGVGVAEGARVRLPGRGSRRSRCRWGTASASPSGRSR